jgi:hypothetical protein
MAVQQHAFCCSLMFSIFSKAKNISSHPTGGSKEAAPKLRAIPHPVQQQTLQRSNECSNHSNRVAIVTR